MKSYSEFWILILVALLAFLIKLPTNRLAQVEEYSDQYSSFENLYGLDVHYRDLGEGVPVILVHGTSSSLHTWDGWQEEMNASYRTIALDMQGGGLTEVPADNDYSIQAYVGLIDALVEHLELDSFYLAGNSLGGHTAWDYAANSQYSDKVKKLVLLDPSGFFIEDRPKPLVFKMAQSKFLHSIIEYVNTAPFVSKSLKEVYFDDSKVTPELVKRYQDLGSLKGQRSAFFYKVQAIAQSSTEDLEKITCPTLIQWGRQDEWIPLELAEIFSTHISDNELIVYDNCGHVPMEEIPVVSAKDAINFFNN